jgi:5'-3' exonuclease
MTCSDLWTKLLQNVKKHKAPLSTLNGSTVAVDISIWLHQILGIIDEVAINVQMHPPYQPVRLVREMKRRHKILVDAGLKTIYVFDGRRHSMKDVARENRDSPLESARKWLNEFYSKGLAGESISDEERDEALKRMKEATEVSPELVSMVVDWMREENIQFLCAPFEAEWQCVALVLDKLADNILSTDGDCVILGAPKAIVELSFSSQQCCVYDRAAVFEAMTNSKYDISEYQDLLPEMAAFLGCDYIKRVRGYGVDKVFKKRLPGFVQAKDKRHYLANLAGVPVKDRQSYADRFIQVTNLFRHAPVLRRQDEEWVLQPLTPLPNNDASNWASMIGFGNVQHPSELLPVDATLYSKAALFDGCSFLVDDGGPLPSFTSPFYENSNTPLPTYAKIDFEKIPVACVQSIALHQFVNARMPSVVAQGCPRDELEDAVERVMHQKILPCNKVPKIIDRWRLTNVLKGIGKDWDNDDVAVTSTIRSLATIDEVKDVQRFYPHGNEANLERARRLVDGGNVLVRESLRCRLCCDLMDDSPAVLFQCDVVPHMKGGPNSRVKSENTDGTEKDYYTVYLCFRYDMERKEARRVRGFPHSSCGCHDGRYFCSHMLALLSVLSLKQKYTIDQFELAYARSPLFIQNLPMLIENLTRRDKAKRKKAQSARKKGKKQRVAWYNK